MNDELMTIDELANKLKVKRSWIYQYSRQTGPGTIPRIKIGKYLRFRLDEVMEWVEKNQN